MGRKKTYVGTQIARVIEDEKLPDSIRKGLVDALFSGGEIVDHVLEELSSNIGTRAERLYAFAKNGNYVHGLPSGQFMTPGTQLAEVIDTVLEQVHSAPVTVKYANYGPANSMHIGWMALVNDHGYDPATNILGALTTSIGVTVYLEDMVLVVPFTQVAEIESASLPQWGRAAKAGYTPERKYMSEGTRDRVLPTLPEVDDSTTVEYLRVEYMYINGSEETVKASFTIPITGFNDNAQYVHAQYLLGGAIKYNMYEVGSGGFPEIDELFDTQATANGEFFPFIYFRYGKVSEIEDKTTESYKDNAKLVKYLGIEYDAIAEGVEANPDIDDVEQAMIMFAVPANTENEQERAYLYEFFTNLYMSQGADLRFQTEAQADIAARQRIVEGIEPPSVVIQDQRFKLSLSNQGIYRIKKFGSVAPIGQHTSGTATFIIETPMKNVMDDSTFMFQTPVTYHYYRRQLTTALYEEIQVVQLQTKFHINGEYSVTGDETDTILLIPLDHSITEKYSVPDREVLYARSLHYVFNSLLTIKLKWYQTGIFQALMIVISVVVTIYTGDPSLLMAALATGATAVVLSLIVNMILQYIIAKIVFKLFVKAVGAEAAFVIAIVAAIAGVTMSLKTGSLAGSPWAQDLLSLANGLSNAIGSQLQSDMSDLLGEMSEFSTYVEEQTKVLETAKDLLDQNIILSPFVIFGETPDDFYNRTVHSGNIGVVGIDAIASFVDSKLALPRIDETLGFGTGGERYVG